MSQLDLKDFTLNQIWASRSQAIQEEHATTEAKYYPRRASFKATSDGLLWVMQVS